MAAVDPFAGTCGCLLAATHLTGAAATAADVDGDALRGALANFDAAGLPRPTILECPVDALVERLGGAAFDAIVTDPPYGKRERIAGGDARWLEELLGLADDALKVGGRCVFFVPHGDDASADGLETQNRRFPAPRGTAAPRAAARSRARCAPRASGAGPRVPGRRGTRRETRTRSASSTPPPRRRGSSRARRRWP